jgi:hypothetical protein
MARPFSAGLPKTDSVAAGEPPGSDRGRIGIPPPADETGLNMDRRHETNGNRHAVVASETGKHMKTVFGSLLLILVLSGCAGAERTKMDTGTIVPSANGKCQAMAGMREIPVDCPAK